MLDFINNFIACFSEYSKIKVMLLTVQTCRLKYFEQSSIGHNIQMYANEPENVLFGGTKYSSVRHLQDSRQISIYHEIVHKISM